MKGFKLFGAEWGRVFRNKKVLIPVIAVLFIPLMYSGMFLGAFWDPYARLADLPVAVVNMDKGATIEGEKLQVGADLVEQLKERKDFDFQYVNQSEAEAGLKDDRYYMSITIPANFSEQATTLIKDNPQPAEILFQTNEGHNFLAAQIGGSAVKEVNAEVSRRITEAYTELMFEQVEKVSDGLQQAGEGAGKLNDGTKELRDGAQELKRNMAKLADGALQLKQGTAPLADGVNRLGKGAQDLKQGASSLTSGLDQLSAAHKQLEQGAVQAQQGTNKLEQGLQTSAAGSAKLNEGAEALAEGLAQLSKLDPELANNPAVKQLVAASQGVLQGSQQLKSGQQQLLAGAGQLKSGQNQLTAGMKQFGTKLNEAAQGSRKVAGGAQQLSTGATQLQAGLGKATQGISELSSGASQLDAGAGKLHTGTNKLADGSNELATKLDEAADKASAVKSSEARIKMYAQPVKVTEGSINKVPNYGTGFAPYFLSLGLFVGALIITIVLPLVQSPDPLATGYSRFVSKTLLFLSVGVMQALLADAVLLFGLGLEVKSVSLFILFSIITSMTYMFIIQSLVTILGDPGRFVAIVLLILQLVTCGGTFPMELTPGVMQAIGPWLPMTYSVYGFKAVISSGDYSYMWSQAGIMSIYIVVFGAMTLTFFMKKGSEAKTQAAV
ncbi:YhgE/Pip domain-containing protein [Paenibacillus sp. 481]|uniref:YhgE/Pip domain-containing protein n=1 Tax=Paenibacillus sp. 481 TaxID=2835869 RepID=UPI001E2958E5|nr:YhgE/Pip domain-containing protein [Paenibacillus sp. 481]UHA71950.1 YhgE/Pip domain-containing protein [Paenibacillus sp. 481]